MPANQFTSHASIWFVNWWIIYLQLVRNMYTHTSHTDFSTDLSWDGQSLILWQQWRREGLRRGGLEGGKTVIKCCVEVQHMCTHTHTM